MKPGRIYADVSDGTDNPVGFYRGCRCGAEIGPFDSLAACQSGPFTCDECSRLDLQRLRSYLKTGNPDRPAA